MSKMQQVEFAEQPDIVLSFGKHVDKPVSWLVENHPHYATWLMTLPAIRTKNWPVYRSLRYHLARAWAAEDAAERAAEPDDGGAAFRARLAAENAEIARRRAVKAPRPSAAEQFADLA